MKRICFTALAVFAICQPLGGCGYYLSWCVSQAQQDKHPTICEF
jgi:hypothetical protein